MTWQTFAFLIVAGSAFGYSGYRFSILLKMMKNHQGKAPEFGQLYDRIVTTIINVLGQKAVLKKKSAGIMHATIFWGFLIISIGTLEQFVTTLYQPANFQFIGSFAYSALVLVQDVFTLAVLLAVLYACYRRFLVRPEGLGKSTDGIYLVHECFPYPRRQSLVQ
jgi:hypothetical protein